MDRRDFLVRGTSLCGVAVGAFLFRPSGPGKKPPPRTTTTTAATTAPPTTAAALGGSTYAGVYAGAY